MSVVDVWITSAIVIIVLIRIQNNLALAALCQIVQQPWTKSPILCAFIRTNWARRAHTESRQRSSAQTKKSNRDSHQREATSYAIQTL